MILEKNLGARRKEGAARPFRRNVSLKTVAGGALPCALGSAIEHVHGAAVACLRRVSSEYGARAEGRLCGVEEADGAAVKERFVAEKLTAMAGLRPALVNDKLRDEGYGVLDGHYAMVEQASGVPKAKGEEAFEWLRQWIEEVKANGLVASLTEEFGVTENLLVRKRLSILKPAWAET